MDTLIALAIHVGKLEARIETLEKLLEKGEKPAFVAPETEITEEQKEEQKLMEGFDNLMSYQWPPKKDGEE